MFLVSGGHWFRNKINATPPNPNPHRHTPTRVPMYEVDFEPVRLFLISGSSLSILVRQ